MSALDLRDADVIGYRVEAADGYVGRAADYCVEEESWVVTGVLVAMRGAKPVFVPLNAIDRIDQPEKTIYVTPTREEVRQGSRRSSR